MKYTIVCVLLAAVPAFGNVIGVSGGGVWMSDGDSYTTAFTFGGTDGVTSVRVSVECQCGIYGGSSGYGNGSASIGNVGWSFPDNPDHLIKFGLGPDGFVALYNGGLVAYQEISGFVTITSSYSAGVGFGFLQKKTFIITPTDPALDPPPPPDPPATDAAPEPGTIGMGLGALMVCGIARKAGWQRRW